MELLSFIAHMYDFHCNDECSQPHFHLPQLESLTHAFQKQLERKYEKLTTVSSTVYYWCKEMQDYMGDEILVE